MRMCVHSNKYETLSKYFCSILCYVCGAVGVSVNLFNVQYLCTPWIGSWGKTPIGKIQKTAALTSAAAASCWIQNPYVHYKKWTANSLTVRTEFILRSGWQNLNDSNEGRCNSGRGHNFVGGNFLNFRILYFSVRYSALVSIFWMVLALCFSHSL